MDKSIPGGINIYHPSILPYGGKTRDKPECSTQRLQLTKSVKQEKKFRKHSLRCENNVHTSTKIQKSTFPVFKLISPIVTHTCLSEWGQHWIRKFDAKPLSKPMLGFCQLQSKIKFTEILIKIQNISFTKMHLKFSSAKWQPFCTG